MLNSPLGGRRGIGFGLGRSWQRVAAGVSWWLAGGIDQANCKGAWQSIAASSYSESLNDLSGNDKDLNEIVAPSWNTTDGWVFTGSQYLLTGVIPLEGWSLIARVQSTAAENRIPLMASSGSGKEFGFSPYFINKWTIWYGISNNSAEEATLSDTVGAITNGACYKDGEQILYLGSSGRTFTVQLPIGAFWNGSSPNFFFKGYIKAVALYDINIAPYISALTTAIQAL